ncbi:MAG: hypothetical protein IPI67_38570 [Myxococcales bacterium]|nr:hypothetical protein [Myxococcales bacterium]
MAEVEYHLAKTGQKIGKVTVQVRAWHLTFLQFEPNLQVGQRRIERRIESSWRRHACTTFDS